MATAFVITAFALVVSIAYATEVPEYCSLPPETGNCRASIPMFHYNSSLRECVEFIYGGCPGNDNRFSTKEDCIRTCSPDVCLLPPEVGPCKAAIRLWFYNAQHRQCQQFSYGGCQGNQNRFRSQRLCESACAGINLPCALGSDFETVGYKAVHENYRDREFFSYDCGRRCRQRCTGHHPWGTCLSYSTRKRWYGCNCYLFDRFLSKNEFDYDTKGSARNRVCQDSGEVE
ncbi:hypothetical protein CAPTEDRAFT_227921 [Capitella teleta]|uniref:BPTI/Kunitz inhibitor domain-containing protein n=1 Tax=Capitella teleta TaxID=283909 RepID=R7TWC0_CAPTE|nr:hypothetical protein CAPTEDRAFT_227921 [Capitella teleta]|eukprot:ELT95275.1 hypothetical protein CAPTEDRAFT_227921 [Capitella teleta]